MFPADPPPWQPRLRGKTRFARLLAEELAAPYELISCGGLSDSAIGGTGKALVRPAEPSLAIMAIRLHECAGPVIILDEDREGGLESTQWQCP